MLDDMAVEHPLPGIVGDEGNADLLVGKKQHGVDMMHGQASAVGTEHLEAVAVHVDGMQKLGGVLECKDIGAVALKSGEWRRKPLVVAAGPALAVDRPVFLAGEAERAEKVGGKRIVGRSDIAGGESECKLVGGGEVGLGNAGSAERQGIEWPGLTVGAASNEAGECRRFRSAAIDKPGAGAARGRAHEEIEAHVSAQGWFTEPPERAIGRWNFRAAVVLVLGVGAIILSGLLPSTGLLMLGWGVAAAAVAIFVIARAMPQRTLKGATVNAWLAAYRRTLRMTMEQSRSADQVVAARAIPWLDSPDQVAVWGYALGLQDEVQALLERSVDVVREQRGTAWIPVWYITSGHGAGLAGVATAGAGSPVLPDLSRMTAALATVGMLRGSGSGGSGGFSGGMSGIGGGAGGGF